MTRPAEIGAPVIRSALAAATERLLAERTADGHWVGELSASALSTATASFALHLAGPADHAGAVRRGLDWLADHQNDDGGWGDTTGSRSNLSTTVLGWSALAAAAGDPSGGQRPAHERAVAEAERYIAAQCGSLDADAVARAVMARYGEDRTFSVPILTMCALAGRLGEGRQAWRHVAQLPFELAACPHGMFKALRLPVVSYALPALIAIGQARHHHRPTRNPLARLARAATRRRTLRLLAEIQPPGGGFLEAAPLTSFVLMSLLSLRDGDWGKAIASPQGADLAGSLPTGGDPRASIIRSATGFLVRAVRPDGAWPIDTNLATWVTTLAANALPADSLDAGAREAIRRWLLDQQHAVEHPYTRAAPGGWAWTDLPGGVPDADDTAGALRALRRLGPADERTELAAAEGCWWLLKLQNADGGVPTFCRGWGRLPFDRSCHDLTAHALLAWSAWLADLPMPLAKQVRHAMHRGMDFLLASQGPDGRWLPLWFGNEHAAGEANPVYGTARVLLGLSAMPERLRDKLAGPLRRGAEFLLAARGQDGGWGGDAGAPASIEETALAVDALAALLAGPAAGGEAAEAIRAALAGGASWLVERTGGGRDFPPAPIGLYFARLWYFEKLYPLLFTVSALRHALGALPG